MYGAFHIAAVLVVVIAAVSGAATVSRACRQSRARVIRILAVCGWILAILEVYKQLFLYHIVNGGTYDWWYFPFQLCSVPMYLCILLPVLCKAGKAAPDPYLSSECGNVNFTCRRSKSCTAMLTFLATYTFVGAVAALAVPEDFLRSYVTLTLHGFIWHGILLFICLVVVFSGIADLSCGGFMRATALFGGLCVIAVIINVLTEPVMAKAHAAGLVPDPYAAMFYLNPYHISPQPIVDTVQKSAGIPLGLALYVIVIIAASGLAALVFRRLLKARG